MVNHSLKAVNKSNLRRGIMKDFLFFRRMITPWLITLTFWLGSILCIASGVYCLYNHQWGMVFPVLVLGPLGLRLVCEWFILAFRINETLTDIKQTLEMREKL
ncbi:MAG: hypothetical protein K0S11_1065 [Gammaproteobacteria bacterium]|jgi:hypothetical protein|nr:hypothetical protein [Gammaproteobacteria bacterium]